MTAPESRRRLSKRSIALIAAGSALVLVAAGTAAAFALAPRDSPEAEVVETPAIETPVPVVTNEPVDRPTAPFSVDCDALVPSGFVAGTLGTGATHVATDDTISNLHDAYRVQTGAVGCSWSSGDAGATSRIAVILIPDALSDFARLAGGDEFMEPRARDAFGDSSFHGCQGFVLQGVTSFGCVADVLIGDTWASIGIAAPGNGEESVERLEVAASHLATAVRALTVTPSAWTPPVSPLTAEVMVDLDAATVAASLGMTDAFPGGTDVDSVTGAMMHRTGFSIIDWTSPSDFRSVTVEALPGGAWAAAEFARASDAVDVAGAEDASIRTLDDGRPQVCLAARNAALCFVPSAPTDRQAFVAQVAAFVASLPGA